MVVSRSTLLLQVGNDGAQALCDAALSWLCAWADCDIVSVGLPYANSANPDASDLAPPERGAFSAESPDATTSAARRSLDGLAKRRSPVPLSPLRGGAFSAMTRADTTTLCASGLRDASLGGYLPLSSTPTESRFVASRQIFVIRSQ